MNKIEWLLKNGWTIDEIRFDRYQGFYYVGATHEGGEVEAALGAEKELGTAIEIMFHRAKQLTPAWYLEQIKNGSIPS